jgi:uncharacterized protein (DUF305 family)
MSTRNVGIAVALVIAVAIGTIALVGGGEAEATETDGAFVTQMVPHHESAIQMAEVAQVEATHPEVKALADDIIASQSDEIDSLNAIHERLYGTPVGEMDHGSMDGMSMSEMGMDMSATDLEGATPFDREFIDMMIPHHQGAIVMARAELAEGEDEEARALATEIIEAQSTEIEQMNAWRTDWYGAPSPAGGVPVEDSAETGMSGSMPGMDH